MDLEVREDKILYTVKETASILGVNVHLIYSLITKGILPALKLGSLKVRKTAIEEFVLKYEGMDLSNLDNIIELKTID